MRFIKEIPGLPKPVAPYSIVTKANGFLFLSGQVALLPETGKLVEGGIEEQTRQVLKNLKSALVGSGSAVDKIVMSTIFLASMADFKTVNQIYAEFVVPGSEPARQTVAVKELPLGALIEISLIAVE